MTRGGTNYSFSYLFIHILHNFIYNIFKLSFVLHVAHAVSTKEGPRTKTSQYPYLTGLKSVL